MRKKNFWLVPLFSLLIAGCGSRHPSSPEDVLKNGIQAYNNKDMNEVNRYYLMLNWEDVLNCKEAFSSEEYDQSQNETSIDIIKVKKEDVICWILTEVTLNNGMKENREYTIHKMPSGRWVIDPMYSSYDFVNEIN